jgi:large subunit ribosomal protein L13
MPEGKNKKSPTKSKTTASDKMETQAKSKEAKGKREAASEGQGAKKGGCHTAPKRNPLIPKTPMPKVGELNQEWKLVDAANMPLGRLSSHIAMMLMGKTKPSYSPSIDTGDHVVVINAEKVVLTGKKWSQKVYQYHTNYPGGIKTFTAKEILNRRPERLVKLAVYRMLPKSKGHMARTWFGKLRVYTGTDHPHKAQQPKPVKLPNLGTH